MASRRRRSHSSSPRGGSLTQSWFSLVAFILAILLILLFNRQAGESAAGCFSSTVDTDGGSSGAPDATSAR